MAAKNIPYELNGKKYALIIDNSGSEANGRDITNLKNILESLQFTLRIESEKTRDDIRDILEEIAEDENYFNMYSCFLLIYFSRDQTNRIADIAVPDIDGNMFDFDLERFQMNRSLEGKPKIFIFHHRVLAGNTDASTFEDADEEDGPQDCLLVYSYYDCIDLNNLRLKGSDFIRMLCGGIEQRCNLTALLNQIKNDFRIDYGSDLPTLEISYSGLTGPIIFENEFNNLSNLLNN